MSKSNPLGGPATVRYKSKSVVPCGRCGHTGFVCAKCKEGADDETPCRCPYSAGKQPGLIKCPDCGGEGKKETVNG